jgi:hypothetical protein
VKRAAAAALIALLAASAPALGETKVGGKVLTAEITPDAGNGSGKLVIVDKGGRTSRYGIDGATHVTKDGKPAAFEETLVGDMVVRAKYDPKTKVLTLLDLKSTTESKPAKAAAAKPAAAYVTGEVAFADALKGMISVRQGPGKTRDFAVTDATKVLRVKAEGATQEIGLENVAVGDLVEVRSTDGKTADSVRVRPAAK